MVLPRLRRPQIGYKEQIFPRPGDLDALQMEEWQLEQDQQLQDWRDPLERGFPPMNERQASFRKPSGRKVKKASGKGDRPRGLLAGLNPAVFGAPSMLPALNPDVSRLSLIPTGDTRDTGHAPPVYSRDRKEQEKYLAQRRLRGVSDLALGAGDLTNMAVNAGLRDVGYFAGAKPDDVYQFPMPSQAAANLATEATGTRIVPEETMPWDVRQKGANQQALMGMLPVGPEAVVGPALGILPPMARAVKGGKKVAKAVEEILPEPGGLLAGTGTWKKHPISSIKTTVPVEQMHAEYEPYGKMLPEKQIGWEDLEGHNIIPLLGDPTITGKRLMGVGGQRFEKGVELPGGPGFPRFGGGNWANTPGAASTMGKTVAGLEGSTSGVYMKMSEHSGDYAAHMAQAVNEQFKLARPGISKDAITAFDEAMRADWIKNKKGGYEYPATRDWPGMENMTDEWIMSHPVDRKKMVKMMNQRPWQDAGFPDIGYARWATTEPELLNVPTYSSGHSVIRFDPEGKVIRDPAAQEVVHPTYPHQPVGTYQGRLPEVPIGVLHPEYLATGGTGGKPISPSHLYKFLQTRPPIIRLGAERLERVMKYLASKEGGKLGLGGAVVAGLISQSEADEINRGVSDGEQS